MCMCESESERLHSIKLINVFFLVHHEKTTQSCLNFADQKGLQNGRYRNRTFILKKEEKHQNRGNSLVFQSFIHGRTRTQGGEDINSNCKTTIAFVLYVSHSGCHPHRVVTSTHLVLGVNVSIATLRLLVAL